jgi:hypothetical protein
VQGSGYSIKSLGLTISNSEFWGISFGVKGIQTRVLGIGYRV